MNIGNGHKNNEQSPGMLINDLLDMQATLHIVDEAVLINKHDRWTASRANFSKCFYALNIVNISFLHSTTGQVSG